MKALKIIFLLLLFAIVLTFAYQNLEKVNVTFINWSITVPFSLTIFLSFIIGVLAGVLAISSSRKKKKEKSDVELTEARVENAKTENKQQKTDFAN
ncbi:MAG: LapA family protein [Bacteroidales bacterium]